MLITTQIHWRLLYWHNIVSYKCSIQSANTFKIVHLHNSALSRTLLFKEKSEFSCWRDAVCSRVWIDQRSFPDLFTRVDSPLPRISEWKVVRELWHGDTQWRRTAGPSRTTRHRVRAANSIGIRTDSCRTDCLSNRQWVRPPFSPPLLHQTRGESFHDVIYRVSYRGSKGQQQESPGD